jgi:hypothetical protein
VVRGTKSQGEKIEILEIQGYDEGSILPNYHYEHEASESTSGCARKRMKEKVGHCRN